MPQKQGVVKTKSPATPAKGSSPITPPGGSAPKPLVKPDQWWLPAAPAAPKPAVRAPAPAPAALVKPDQWWYAPAPRPGGNNSPQGNVSPQAGLPAAPSQEFSVPNADYGPQLPPPPPMTGVSWGNQPSRYPGIPTPQATVNALKGLGAVLFPPAAAIASAADTFDMAVNRPAELAAKIPMALKSSAVRLGQIPENINKPVTQDEAVSMKPRGGGGRGMAGSVVPPGAPAGTDPSLGLKIKRALGETGGALVHLLNESYMETTGRAIGMGVGLSAPRQAQAQSQLEEWIKANNLDNVPAKNLWLNTTGLNTAVPYAPQNGKQRTQGDIYRQMGQSGQWGNITGFKPEVTPLTQENVAEAWAKGRDVYDSEAVPLWVKLVLPFTALDPLAWAGIIGKGGREAEAIRNAYHYVELPTPGTAENVLDAVRSGKAFYEGDVNKTLNTLSEIPVVGKVFARTSETNARLMADAASMWTSGMASRGRYLADRMDTLTAMAKYASGDASWIEDAARVGLAPRVATAEEVAQLGYKAGQIISPIESAPGKMAALIAQEIAGAPNKKAVVKGLLTTIEKGMAEGADAKAVDLSHKAATELLGLYAQASRNLLGVKKVENAATVTQRIFAEYQGIYSRYFQLNNPGRLVRNMMGNTTSGWANDALAAVPPNWETQWKAAFGKTIAVRGLGGAGYEQTSGLPKLIGKIFGAGAEKVVAGLSLEKASAASEDVFARMAHYKGVSDVYNFGWRHPNAKVLSEELYQAAVRAGSQQAADRLIAAAKGAWHPGEVDDALKVILGGESWRIPSAQFGEFVAGHPDALAAIKAATSPEDLRASFAAIERKMLSDLTGFQPVLPPQDDFIRGFKQGAIDSGIERGSELDTLAAEAAAARNAGREPKEMAQAWAEWVKDKLSDPAAKADYYKKWRDIQTKYQQVYQEVAGYTNGTFFAAKKTGDELAGVKASAMWAEAYKLEEAEYYRLMEEATAGMKAADVPPLDVMRAVSGSEAPTSPPVAQAAEAVPQTPPIKVMITRADEAALRARGYSQADINAMRPEEAGRILSEAIPPKTVIPDTVSLPNYVPPQPPKYGRIPDAPPVAPPPDPVLSKKFTLPHEIGQLRALRDEVLSNWGNKYSGDLTPEQVQALKNAADNIKTQLVGTRAAADFYGTRLRDATYHNYGDQRNFDPVLKMGYAYPYWYTREIASWARNYFQNPHALYAMNNLYTQLRQYNDEDLPEYLRNNFNITLGNGGLLSIPWLNNIDPLANIRRADYRDPVISQSDLGQAYYAIGDFGPGSLNMGVTHLFSIAAQMTGDPELAYRFAPRFGLTSQLMGDVSGGMAAPERILGIGMVGYQMHYVRGPDGDVYVGVPSDAKAVQRVLMDMQAAGRISQEEASLAWNITQEPYDPGNKNDPSYNAAWNTYLTALQESRLARIPRDLLSWGVGPSGRIRSETEINVAKAQTAYSELRTSKDTLSPEAYAEAQRAFWTDPANVDYNQYVYYNKKGRESDEAFSWNVLSRIGKGLVNDPYLTASGIDGDLLGEFYANGGMPENWTANERDSFMASIRAMGAVLAMPERPTADEWTLATSRWKAMVVAQETEFSPESLALFDAYLSLPYAQKKAFAEAHPEVYEVKDWRDNFIATDEVNNPATGKPERILAAYYASESTLITHLYAGFYAEHAPAKSNIDTYQELLAMAKQDPAYKDVASQFWEDNKVELDQYKADLKVFKAGLENELLALKELIPDPKLPKLLDTPLDGSVFTERLTAAQQEQAAAQGVDLAEAKARFGAAGEPDAARTKAEQYAARMLPKIEAEQEAENKRLGYMTGPNRDIREVTLYDTVLAPQGYDPKKAMESFYTVASEGWPVYQTIDTPQELLAYKGDSLHLREQIMIDTTNKWAQVVAYVRTLTPDQLKQLKAEIPDIEWVYAHAQRWDDGPSEAARSDIIGENVTFNVDGTITLSRMSTKEYESGTSNPGTGKAPSGGGTGTGAGGGKKSTKGIDWNKYYGGEGPALPGHPRDTGRNYSGGGYGGSDYGSGGQESGYAPRAGRQPYVDPQAAEGAALMEEWDTFTSTMSQRPDLLVRIQDYFSANETSAQQMLAQFPELALWVSKLTPEQQARLKKAWLVWALENGKMGSTQATRYEAAMPEFGPTLRYYSRRSGRSGLQG